MNNPSMDQRITYAILRRVIDELVGQGGKPPFSKEQVHEATRRVFKGDPQLQWILDQFTKNHI